MVRVDIETIVMAAGPVPSLIVLRERCSKSDSPAPLRSLSIQTGSFEAAAISRGIDSGRAERPITHDLLLDTVGALGAKLERIEIVRAEPPVFYATVVVLADGNEHKIDARPSDAIALAVRALKNKEIKKIILSRPAVEAGEKLGFLPGDMKDKIDPYLQPLYDALQDMVPAAKLKEYMELNIIQIAPLAFMRGRTLNDAVVILDEAQNTTTQQIKMFLTRMGMNTKMIVTGDMTQIDLPQSQTSGLVQALRILKGVKGISFIELNKKDIVRHKLVTQIVEAYEKFDKEAKAEREKRKAEQAAGQQLPA